MTCPSPLSSVRQVALAEPFRTVLVCIAGTNARGGVGDLLWQAWCREMEVNVRSAMLATKHARPQLQTGSSIVLISSVSAHIGTDALVAYHTSKGPLSGLMRASSGEFAPRRIRVNAVSPGWVDSPFTDHTDHALAEMPKISEVLQRAGDAHILGRTARPDEVADATEIIVDGGFMRNR